MPDLDAAPAPHGTWPSPLGADTAARGVVRLQWPRAAGSTLVWHETRLDEGRSVVVRWTPDADAPVDCTPAGRSSRNGVNGYGGIPHAVLPGGTVVACDAEDGRLWDLDRGVPLTPPAGDGSSWGDLWPMADGALVGIRTTPVGPLRDRNEVVLLPAGGGDPVVLATGRDFVAAPRPSPDGRRVAWLTWDQPAMPWDGTELWVADLDASGAADARRVAGGPTESLVEPRWTPDGRLVVASDRTGWWSLYRCDLDATDGHDPLVPLLAIEGAEVSQPLWMVGLQLADAFADGRLAVTWVRDAVNHVGVLHPDGRLEEVATPYTTIRAVAVLGERIALIAGTPHDPLAVVVLDPAVGGAGTVVRRSTDLRIPADLVSAGEPITFPTAGGAVAHAIWRPPHLPGHRGEEGARPPVVVTVHGGPTSAYTVLLDPVAQFFTTRGFGYVELNHRGSSGHGRAYRDALRGNWGTADVEDAEAVVAHLAAAGLCDPDRAVIRGLSAGGWTTLQAMTTSEVFAAGCSTNGVADGRLLAEDTHMFEARYLDSLLGPLPDAAETYDARSAARNAHRIRRPLLVVQGLADEVVVPRHAEDVVAAAAEHGAPVTYLPVPDEGHLFLRADTVEQVLEAELAFIRQALALDPRD